MDKLVYISDFIYRITAEGLATLLIGLNSALQFLIGQL